MPFTFNPFTGKLDAVKDTSSFITAKGDWVIIRNASALDVNESSFAPLEQFTATNIIRKVRSFDYNTIEYCDGMFEVHPDIDASGTVTFSVLWQARTAPATAENVVWQYEHSAVANEEDIDSASYTAEVAGADSTTDTQNALIRTTWTETVSNLGWVAGDMVYDRWSRKSTDANDTFDTRADTNDDALLYNTMIICPLA